MKTSLPLFLMSLIWHLLSVLPVQAQFHFQGLKGMNIEYGISPSFDRFYSIGYQFFLDNSFQIELNTGYEQGAYFAETQYLQYDAATHYHVQNFYLHETVDYSFLKLFKRLYINLGVGLTQAFEQPKVNATTYTIDSVRLASIEQAQGFDENAVELDNKLRIGGHANLLAELYLNRYVALLARYRLLYVLQSHYDPWRQQPSVGIRINF